LLPKNKDLREEQLPKDEGIAFSNLLDCRSRYSSFCSKPKSTGIEPENLFALRLSVCNSLSCPNSFGILPLKELLEKSRVCKKERLPRNAERVPSSPKPGRIIATTL
jgi:hypothetical protein